MRGVLKVSVAYAGYFAALMPSAGSAIINLVRKIELRSARELLRLDARGIGIGARCAEGTLALYGQRGFSRYNGVSGY
jgi:hypothetical protein